MKQLHIVQQQKIYFGKRHHIFIADFKIDDFNIYHKLEETTRL